MGRKRSTRWLFCQGKNYAESIPGGCMDGSNEISLGANASTTQYAPGIAFPKECCRKWYF